MAGTQDELTAEVCLPTEKVSTPLTMSDIFTDVCVSGLGVSSDSGFFWPRGFGLGVGAPSLADDKESSKLTDVVSFCSVMPF